MKTQTWTVLNGYVDRAGRHMVFLRDRPQPVPADEALPEGAAVVIRDGKAVRA